MKASQFAIILVLLASAMPSSSLVSAQEPGVPEWTMGWLTDMDDPVVMEYDSNWYFDQELVFYIENTRLVELNVEFVYELSDEDFFEIVGDETGKVAGGANESFTIQVRPVNDADMRSFSPDSIVTLDVTAAETSQVGMSTSSNTIDGEFKVEKVFDLSLEFVDGPTQMHAGTWVDWNLQLVNNGNNDDTASSSGIASMMACSASFPELFRSSSSLIARSRRCIATSSAVASGISSSRPMRRIVSL